jgi:hypothetical protein
MMNGLPLGALMSESFIQTRNAQQALANVQVFTREQRELAAFRTYEQTGDIEQAKRMHLLLGTSKVQGTSCPYCDRSVSSKQCKNCGWKP